MWTGQNILRHHVTIVVCRRDVLFTDCVKTKTSAKCFPGFSGNDAVQASCRRQVRNAGVPAELGGSVPAIASAVRADRIM